jgi:hypothetical protein
MQKHSRPTPEGRAFWYTERLWELAKDLPVKSVPIDSIPEFEMNCWFREAPTCREVALHARQILDADLSYPIILHADGGLMDGGHRLAKAWLAGETFVQAHQFSSDPAPDFVEPSIVEAGQL